MEKKYNIAIVGAPGAVGGEIIRVLEEREFPVGELRLLADVPPEDGFLDFGDEEIVVGELTGESFAGIDIALFCADARSSCELAPAAVAAGAVCIDCTSAWSEDPEVPLVVPEVNPREIEGFRNKGIIASPDSVTIQTALPLKALHDSSPVRRVVVSTYQAVSASGTAGIDELRIQSGELLNGRPAESSVFDRQIAFNCLPRVGELLDNGYTAEEMKLVTGTRRILADEDLRVTVTAVHVPVFYGHSAAINVETAGKIDAAKARELLSGFPGIEVLDDGSAGTYPTPADAAGEDLVQVGRIREDASIPNGLNLWTVADNLRKGAATNAVQIAELLVRDYLG